MITMAHCDNEKCIFEGFISGPALSQELCPLCFSQGSLQSGKRKRRRNHGHYEPRIEIRGMDATIATP